MALTNAERQAKYRASKISEGDERLNLLISASAKRALEDLAESHKVTQKEMLEKLLDAAARAQKKPPEGG